MEKVRSVDFLYTLYKDDNGSYILDLVIPSRKNAWANYEKRVVVSAWEKILMTVCSARADRLAKRLIAEEQLRQKMADRSNQA